MEDSVPKPPYFRRRPICRPQLAGEMTDLPRVSLYQAIAYMLQFNLQFPIWRNINLRAWANNDNNPLDGSPTVIHRNLIDLASILVRSFA